MTVSIPDLFPIGSADESAVGLAETRLLRLADTAYTRTSLKPMSKVLFFVSRCLLALREDRGARDVSSLTKAYERARSAIARGAPNDDFEFGAVLADVGENLDHMVGELASVVAIAGNTDALGLAFDSVLRGKWESGEGLGTFLTPEEVVRPMVTMIVAARGSDSGSDALLGDICGGTGRFVRSLAKAYEARGESSAQVGQRVRLYDQSAMSVGFGQINFAFDKFDATCAVVSDSLTDHAVSRERGKFACLATNPPFGSGKYKSTPALFAALPAGALGCLGVRSIGDLADPAALFLLRNLDLLAPSGVLGIVVPDGIMQSADTVRAVKQLEVDTKKRFELLAVVSLPTRTFALGGTVAKTSFMIWKCIDQTAQDPATEARTFLGRAEHVGFVKRGNRREVDRAGNDLERFARAFVADAETVDGSWVSGWRTHDRLTLGALSAESRARRHDGGLGETSELGTLVVPVRETCVVPRTGNHAHISILSVDETGLIDLPVALADKPITPGLRCKPGDVLVSCLNPRKWRVAVVPDVGNFAWSCSAEFVVFRPAAGVDPWLLALQLQHRDVREAVGHLAVGTSSSRQRVPKHELLDVRVPTLDVDPTLLREVVDGRERFYALRLREVGMLAALSNGNLELR